MGDDDRTGSVSHKDLYFLLHGKLEHYHTRWIDNYRVFLSFNAILLPAVTALFGYAQKEGALWLAFPLLFLCLIGGVATCRGIGLVKRIWVDVQLRFHQLNRVEDGIKDVPVRISREGRTFFVDEKDVGTFTHAEHPKMGVKAIDAYKSVSRFVIVYYALLSLFVLGWWIVSMGFVGGDSGDPLRIAGNSQESFERSVETIVAPMTVKESDAFAKDIRYLLEQDAATATPMGFPNKVFARKGLHGKTVTELREAVARLERQRIISSNESIAPLSLAVFSMAQFAFRRGDQYGIGKMVYANPVNGTGFPDLYRVGGPLTHPDGNELIFVYDAFARATSPENAKDGYWFVDITGSPKGDYDHSIEYGLCAVPAEYGKTGVYTYITSTSSGGTYYKDTEGKPVTRFPDLAKDAWLPYRASENTH